MPSTILVRLVQAVALTAAVIVLVSPPAASAGSSRSTVVPDWFERFAATHPYGHGVLGQPTRVVVDRRSPDTRDGAQPARTRITGRRLPDAADVGRSAPAAARPLSGFDWGRLGVVGALGVALLAIVSVAGLRWMRRRPRHSIQTT
jgi:hypothetical protein